MLPRHRKPRARRDTDEIVPGYRLLSRIGTGGTANVYLALPLDGGAAVAMKIFRPGGAVAECQREFRMASAVDAACTAAPIGHGVTEAGPYLVTAFLPDHRCGTEIMDSAMPVASLLAFGGVLAEVLASMHDSGVVHCDVKPSNLLVGGDDVRVIDFGISQYVGEHTARDGMVNCSRGWSAPEQLRGIPLTPSADVFAWGSVLAYLSTGFHPFAGRHDMEWILRVGSGRPNLSGLHPEIDAVVRAALAHDPADRPSARELAAVCREGDAGRVSPTTDDVRGPTTPRRSGHADPRRATAAWKADSGSPATLCIPSC